MIKGPHDETVRFRFDRDDATVRDVILRVYASLEEKGYNPVSQLVGYLLSGDPTYITSYADARSLIRSVDRDQVLEELVSGYIREHRGVDALGREHRGE